MKTQVTSPDVDLVSAHLCIHRGPFRFGIPMENMVEIREFPHYRKLPLAEDFLLGFISFRNHILPLLDPVLLQSVTSAPIHLPPTVAVVGFGGDGIFGILLDRVGEVIEIDAKHLHPSHPRIPSAFLYEFGDGHGEPIQILNLQGMVRSFDLDLPQR